MAQIKIRTRGFCNLWMGCLAQECRAYLGGWKLSVVTVAYAIAYGFARTMIMARMLSARPARPNLSVGCGLPMFAKLLDLRTISFLRKEAFQYVYLRHTLGLFTFTF